MASAAMTLAARKDHHGTDSDTGVATIASKMKLKKKTPRRTKNTTYQNIGWSSTSWTSQAMSRPTATNTSM